MESDVKLDRDASKSHAGMHRKQRGGGLRKRHSASSSIASMGLEEGVPYTLRLAKPASSFAMQPGGWYLGFFGGNVSGKSDRRSRNSTYVSVVQPGAPAFNRSHIRWFLHSVPGSDAVRISQKSGWYLTVSGSSKDAKDVRDKNSDYSMVISPDASNLPEHDGEWLLEKTRWGSFKLSLMSSRGYLTAHRRQSADFMGKEVTFACVMSPDLNDVPASDGRWILEKFVG